MKIKPKPTELKTFNRATVLPNTIQALARRSVYLNTPLEIREQDRRLVERCQQDWLSLGDFRRRRRRSRNYYQGYQWHEKIVVDGKVMTEEENIMRRGKIPFKQNIIKQIVRNLLGQYRSSPSQSIVYAYDKTKATQAEIMGQALDSALNLNSCVELDAATLEELILSGAALQKVTYRYWHERDREDCYLENTNVNRFFCNTDIRDIRHNDIYRIGEIKDSNLDQLIAQLADTKQKEQYIRQIYSNIDDFQTRRTGSTQEIDSLGWFLPDATNKCRVIDVWYMEYQWRLYVHDTLDGTYQVVDYTAAEIDEMNLERKAQAMQAGIPEQEVALLEYKPKYEPVWINKILSPWGHCLYERSMQYEHQSHPYAIKLSPLLDGEVRGLVEDIIDQQRYINRLISLLDNIMSASAKGVLLIPDDMITEDMNIDDWAEEWSKFNGVIKFKPRPDRQMPMQISANATAVGAHELLALQLKFIMEISGVSNSIQGQEAKAGTPSSLYAQQTQNSLINSKDLFDKFADFKNKRDLKVMKVIKQFYKEPRLVNVGGRLNNLQNSVYLPELADIDMDVKTVQGVDSPVYRAMIDDTLMTLLTSKMISLKMFLEHTSLPFADKLLESLQQEEQQMGGMNNIDPALLGQAQQELQGAANPKAMQMLNQYMGNTKAA